MRAKSDGSVLSVVESSDSTWDAAGASVDDLQRGLREIGVPEESIQRDIYDVTAQARQLPGLRYKNFGEEQLRTERV